MTNIFIALLVSVSLGVWLYSKQMRRSGNNTQSSITIAAIAAVMTFVIIFTFMIMVDGILN